MPYKEKSIEKLYYTIGEISEILGESTSLVRFWAQKFPDFIKPARNKKGNRLFGLFHTKDSSVLKNWKPKVVNSELTMLVYHF